MTAEDQQRLVRFLMSQGYLDARDRRYKAFANRGPGDPYQLSALLQSRDSADRMRSIPPPRGHGGGANVPSDRRHGPDPESLRARDWAEPHHDECRGAVGATGRPRCHGRLQRHEDGTDADAHRRLRGDLPADVDPCRPRRASSLRKRWRRCARRITATAPRWGWR